MNMNDQELKGMTVNERLYAFGLMDKFDAAIRNRDLEASMLVLVEAKFTQAQANETVSSILRKPSTYGY